MLYLWVIVGLGWFLFLYFDGKKKKIKGLKRQIVEVRMNKKGQIVQMHLCPPEEINKTQTLLEEAQKLFRTVMDVFVAGDVERLADLVSPELWTVLKKDIEERKNRKEILEFNLLDFLSVSLLSHIPEKSMTVMFVSEQYQVLKDAQNLVLEGEKNQIVRVKDIWTFKKEGKKWRLMEGKSEPFGN